MWTWLNIVLVVNYVAVQCLDFATDNFGSFGKMPAVQVANLPAVSTFDAEAGDDQTGLGPRWDKWLKRFEIYIVATGVTDDKQKRALLLHSIGPHTFDKFETLDTVENETYEQASTKLTAYFKPKVNVEYERAVFRRSKQEKGETIDGFCTRLRELSVTCDFADKNGEIKSQLIQSTSDSKLRKHALVKEKTLDEVLTEGRTNELCRLQNFDMEKQLATESVKQLNMSGKYKKKSRFNDKPNGREKQSGMKCFSCGRSFPHAGGKTTCPAWGKECRSCGRKGHFEKFCKASKDGSMPKSGDGGKGDKHTKFDFKKRHVHYLEAANNLVDSSSDDELYLFAMNMSEKSSSKIIKPPKFKVTVNGIQQEFTSDTAATVCVMDSHTYNHSYSDCKLNKANPIEVYGGTKVYPLGQFNCTIESRGKISHKPMYVLEGNCCLLSVEASVELGLIKIADHVINSIDSPEQRSKLIGANLAKRFPKLSNGIGKITEPSGSPVQVKLHIDGSVPPVANKHVRVPFRLRKKVEAELTKLEELDVIERVEGPTPWVSPLVVAGKPKNPDEIRLCVNMKNPNKAIKRTRHPIPTLNEIKQQVSGSTVFSKLDLRSGYHQLELAKESRYITTFSTHVGLRRYKRLNFGVNSASEIFQDAVENVIRDVDNAFNISDDIIVHGTDQIGHDKALIAVLQALSDRGATLNWPKCQFNMPELEFYGMIFNAEGMKPDPKKVEAVQKMEPPASKSEVHSFLGMTTYLCGFLQDYSTITAPLREVMKKDVPFVWGEAQQEAFHYLQNILSSETVMAYFDPNRPASLDVDASPVGLGAMLLQADNKGHDKVVAYGSCSLNSAEQNYPQIEREGLAVVWGLEHFHEYVYGEPVTVFTDHEPLESIYGNPNKKLSGRLERWSLRLQPYHASIKYRKGKGKPSDYLSRHTTSCNSSERQSKIAEEYINFLVAEAVPKSMTKEEIIEATEADYTLGVVRQLVKSGRWHDVKKLKEDDRVDVNVLMAYNKVKDELCVTEDGIILRGKQIAMPQSLQSRVVDVAHDGYHSEEDIIERWQMAIPQSLQPRVVQLAHEGHQGEVKTKALLRSKVWFPGVDSMVNAAVKSCHACSIVKNVQQREPIQMTELPKAKWTNLAADFYGPLPSGHHVLVVIDEYSRYPEVDVVKSVSARNVLPALDRIFSARGFPEKLKTDNGSPFQSKEFATFMDVFGIKHHKVTPYWPEANGNAESFMKNLGKVCKTAQLERKPWKQELNRFLRNYRATPHTTTGVAPATLLQGYEMRVKLPQITVGENDKLVRATDRMNKAIMKENAEKRRNIKESHIGVGDTVLMKHSKKKGKSIPPYQEEPFEVTEKKGSMLVAQRGEEVKARNSSAMKKVITDEKPLLVVDDDDVLVDPAAVSNDNVASPRLPEPVVLPEPAILNRPQRTRRVPSRFDQFVMSQ